MRSGHDLLVLWNDEGGSFSPVLKDAAERAMRVAYAPYEGIRAQAEIAVIGSEDMREINREARGMDETTDVLSFPGIKLNGPAAPRDIARRSIDPETGRVALGDILICCERAREQAKAYSHSLERETAFLAVHGLLHLLGYDHVQPAEDALMQEAQEAALAAANLSRSAAVTDECLTKAAYAARKNAYAPYSCYPVGACLLANDGRTFIGVNIENASYGTTICAERAALAAAISQGARVFSAIAISAKTPPVPCGACRQALFEFSPDMRVLVCGDGTATREYHLGDLLPDAFGASALSSSEES